MNINRLTRLVAVLFVVSIVGTPLAHADVTGTLLPTSDGTYAQWTPSAGATHYTLVDESTCNGTTDYNRETTIGERDSYGVDLSGVSDGSKITQISITPCASKNSGGGSNSTMNVFYRFTGVNSADAGSYSVSGTTPVALATTNFSSLSHIKLAASTLQIGAVLSAGTKGVRLSRLAAVVTFTPLVAPTSLIASNVSTNIALNWTDNTTVEDGFKIERSTDGGAFSEITTVGANVVTYTDTTVTANHSYTYQVRAYNTGANSAYTNTATANTVPAAPTSLSATIAGSDIALAWTDNAIVEDGFKIERSTDSAAYAEIATVGVNVTNYTDNTVTANHIYSYRVRAYNAAGNSAYAFSSSVHTYTLPADPTSLSATASGATKIALNWIDNATNETLYKLERKIGAGSFSQIKTFVPNTMFYLDTGTGGIMYTYRVRAFNPAGDSGYSNEASVTLP
ncbi:MAG: fibronectin type III domain-containing protein [Candidatus Peribacteraceae bacterium]